ncbi:MAG: hypothetical protein B6242_08090 [Anaerolineaceae bacterium 4572_78]|nr:MAG: hypothetical protein B6242_08090 [Anaerolineaceae bacterium 4572_78]
MGYYNIEVDKEVCKDIRRLPGSIRQRVWKAIRSLENNITPHNSKELDTEKAGIQLDADSKLYRIRIGVWRIIYFVEEDYQQVSVLGVRKRPPYQYDDLKKLFDRIQ